jgi:Lipocalin-like domain
MHQMHGIRAHALALTFILASQFAGEAWAQGDLAKRLIGTWRLVDIVDDKGKPARGPNPTGYIHYDLSGIMSVQIQPDWERPKFSFGKSTPEQAKAALEGYTAYFGTYLVDEQTATSHIAARDINPGDMGDFVRKIEFRDNRLILRSLDTNNVNTWERVSK